MAKSTKEMNKKNICVFDEVCGGVRRQSQLYHVNPTENIPVPHSHAIHTVEL